MVKKLFIACALLCLCVAFVALWNGRHGTPVHQPANVAPDSKSKPIDSESAQQAGTAAGPKPVTDATKTGADKTADKRANGPDDPFEYGHFPRVPRDANENTKSVFEAAVNHSHPERLSVMLNGKPFDKEAFKQNPKAYLDVVEPGRVFQTAQPGEDVPRKPLVKEQQILSQGEKIELKVKAVPLTLVTFTAFDGGRFDNLLSSMSVQANEQGIASVHYEATSGVIANVNILAASPETSGQVRFGAYVSK